MGLLKFLDVVLSIKKLLLQKLLLCLRRKVVLALSAVSGKRSRQMTNLTDLSILLSLFNIFSKLFLQRRERGTQKPKKIVKRCLISSNMKHTCDLEKHKVG